MRDRIATWPRFLAAGILLVATAMFLRARSRPEVLPPHKPLDTFPLQIGNWKGVNVAIPKWALEVLGSGEFVERNFTLSPNEPSVDLYIAYYPSQKTGSSMHSPQNCLPGSGWTPVAFKRVRVEGPGNRLVPVNRYVLSKGLDRILVIYWFQQHGRIVASEYWSRLYLIEDSIRMNRSDGAMVRLVTHLTNRESIDSGQKRLISFMRQVDPVLSTFVPQ